MTAATTTDVAPTGEDGEESRRPLSVAGTQAGVSKIESLRTRLPALILGLAGIATVVAVWQTAVSAQWVSPLSIPPPGDVVARVGDLLRDDWFRGHLLDTMRAWATAMVVTTAIAVPLGVLVGYFAFLYRSSSTVVNAGRSIPSTALIPIAVLFFGLEQQMKVVVTAYAIFWPILINTSYGVRNVDRVMIQVARSLRWGTFTILRRVVLPSAIPSAATGVRLAGGVALIVVLSSELLAASRGLGTVVVWYQQGERPDYVFACIVIIGVIGIGIYYGLRWIEGRLFPWAGMNRKSS